MFGRAWSWNVNEKGVRPDEQEVSRDATGGRKGVPIRICGGLVSPKRPVGWNR